MANQITIQALKYGNRQHYEWNTTLLAKTDSHIVVLGEYGRQLHHYTKQSVFTIDNWSIEFFSFDSWFTVSAEVVDGRLEQFYCNINQPAVMKGNTVSFVDLDLDYVRRNGVWQVVDEDEFAAHAIQFSYPVDLIQQAEQELVALKEKVVKKEFPFDGYLEKFMNCIPRSCR
jgi:protein associated with RNAse G/E